ncbi:acyl-CoA thioesterase [Massilia aerilata]|uniref:Acyl-CoA thioesterase n=1 Tax=Massilia aerilata TaxID=453817 RepID=A0ABW0RVY0_9BURK
MHTMRQAIRWGDMDVLGHVNNTIYFRYMETGRIAFLEDLNGKFDAKGQGPVIVTAYCTFIKQLKYPGEIEVRTYAGAPGRSSFEVTHEISLVDGDGKAETVYAHGGGKVVWIDFQAEKSVALPERIRSQLPAVEA